MCNRYEIAEFAQEAHELGVGYIGLCCGAGPHHVRSLAEALGRTPPGSRYSPDMSKHAYFGTDKSLKAENLEFARRAVRPARARRQASSARADGRLPSAPLAGAVRRAPAQRERAAAAPRLHARARRRRESEVDLGAHDLGAPARAPRPLGARRRRGVAAADARHRRARRATRPPSSSRVYERGILELVAASEGRLVPSLQGPTSTASPVPASGHRSSQTSTCWLRGSTSSCAATPCSSSIPARPRARRRSAGLVGCCRRLHGADAGGVCGLARRRRRRAGRA